MRNPIVHVDQNNLTQSLDDIRGAYAIVCDDPLLRAQIIKEMHVVPIRSDEDATSIAAERAASYNGKVSAVVINHNYAQWIEQALNSLLAQTRVPDEIIVVDDASTDDSVKVVERYIYAEADEADKQPTPQTIVGGRFKLVQHLHNSGTAGASRNTGIKHASGEYIVTLDSDDMLEPTYVETCLNAIDQDRSIGVVYTGVQTLIEETGQREVIPGWPIPFDWAWMTARKTPPNNCIPTASMFRREMWVRAGGYDDGIRNGEDAEFWIRALSTGYRAVKCTEQPLFIYRRHGPSMSSRTLMDIGAWNPAYKGFKPLAAPTGATPELHDYRHPLVSVIIPVGPLHREHLRTAIASVLAQTVQNVELVIVNDSNAPLNLDAYPFAVVCNANGAEKLGVSKARNMGVEIASAPLVYFLDADDLIIPTALQKLCAVYALGDAGYVYGGWEYGAEGEIKGSNPARPYNRFDWLDPRSEGQHAVSVMMAKEHFLKLGGFDSTVKHFEDWEFFARAAVQGYCGTAVPEPLLIYRRDTGERREDSHLHRQETSAIIAERYGKYFTGAEQMVGCCGGGGNAVQAAQQAERVAFFDTGELMQVDPQHILMQYTGDEIAPTGAFFGQYVGGQIMGPTSVHVADVQKLELTGVWAVMRQPPPHMPMSTNANTSSNA